MISDYSLLYSQAWSFLSLSFTVSKIHRAAFGSWICTHPRCYPRDQCVNPTSIRFQEVVDSRRAVDVPSNVVAQLVRLLVTFGSVDSSFGYTDGAPVTWPGSKLVRRGSPGHTPGKLAPVGRP